MNTISFVVNSVPIAQPRQRHAFINGHAVNYTPKDHPVNAFKTLVAYGARTVYNGPVLREPIGVDIVTLFPRPKNMMWKKREMPREWKVSKPDLDNIQKSVYDALTGVLWHDDSYIAQNSNRKFICAALESPRVEITVIRLNSIND